MRFCKKCLKEINNKTEFCDFECKKEYFAETNRESQNFYEYVKSN